MVEAELRKFIETVWTLYRRAGRYDLPWRVPGADGLFDGYGILVSEVMLQQTQVGRVVPKFVAFLERFPTAGALAAAPLSEVLVMWSGLGYNRRAKFLWLAAQMVVERFDGQLPRTVRELTQLPGVGPNTAGALLVYTYNQPEVFIETNIRSVFIHHFFQGQEAVSDAALRELVERTLDREHPREWYWALMDYGSHLKHSWSNAARASRHYARQSTFEGSLRQVRGQVIRLLTNGPQTKAQLVKQISDERLARVLAALTDEQLIQKNGATYHL